MSFRLKRSTKALVGAALTMALLMALMLALFPAVAEAQTKPQSTSSIVVRPGDCLWSITSERLGPNASPQQIATGVERLYGLNRGQIGADPNLIFPGQVLSLPPMVESSSIEAPSRVRSAPRDAEPAAAHSTARDGNGGKHETERVSSTTVGEVGSKVRQAPELVAKPVVVPVSEPVALPDMPIKQLIPKVDSPSQTEAHSPLESFVRDARSFLSSATSAVVGLFPQAEGLLLRRVLGLGIIVLTLLVAVLMVWKLPMKRVTRFDDEVWGIGSGYYRGTTDHIAPFAYHPGSLGEGTNQGAHLPGGTPEPRQPTAEWELSAELKDSLLSMPLQGTTFSSEHLAKIIYHVEVALEELALLDQRRELFDTECHLQAVLENLYRELSAMAKEHG